MWRTSKPNITRSMIWKSLIASSILRVLLNWVFPFHPWNIFGADIKSMGVWSIDLYQDFLEVIPKAKLGYHAHGDMKKGAIFWMTEPTLNAAFVAPHQLTIGTAPIMA